MSVDLKFLEILKDRVLLLGELAKIDFFGILFDRLYISLGLDMTLQASGRLLSLIKQ